MTRQHITLQVNGDAFPLTVRTDRSLADVLREDLRLIGTKIGCNEGDCGACTVLVDGQTICGCLYLAVEADGREITTIEGLAPGGEELHPVQQAFVERGALQCGFCTPGMVLSAVHLLAHVEAPDEATIRHGLSGNLCRCTGYTKIVDAIQVASERMATAPGGAGEVQS